MAEEKITGIREKIFQDKIISIDSTERAHEQAEKFFEPQLVSIGLSEEEIKSQENIEDLEKSLEQVNNAIQNFQSFGRPRLLKVFS